jgi:hypothetical protein
MMRRAILGWNGRIRSPAVAGSLDPPAKIHASLREAAAAGCGVDGVFPHMDNIVLSGHR